MNNVVFIPNVNRDERIGGAFNHMFSVIYQTEKINDKTVIWDFSNASFFHPFFLAPLILYKSRSQKNIRTVNKLPYIDKYFKLIYFDDMLCLDELADLENIVHSFLPRKFLILRL